MLCRILNILLMLGLSVVSGSSQNVNTYVLSGLSYGYQAGTISLSATLGQPFAAKLTSAGSLVTVGFEQPQMQINTDSLADSILCKQQSLTVPYHAWGYIDTQNVFTAQLSDYNGSFSNATEIGSKAGISSGFIVATVPASLAAGSNYKIRVISSGPKLNGKENPEQLSSGLCDAGMVDYKDNQGFRSFPNPATNLICFYTPGGMIGKIRIYDVTGRVVIELPGAATDSQTLNISQLAKGVYVASYQNAEINRSTKIIKQ